MSIGLRELNLAASNYVKLPDYIEALKWKQADYEKMTVMTSEDVAQLSEVTSKIAEYIGLHEISTAKLLRELPHKKPVYFEHLNVYIMKTVEGMGAQKKPVLEVTHAV